MQRMWLLFSLVILLLLAGPTATQAQSVDHWEAVIQDGSIWRYWLPDSEPPAAWKDPGFYDGAWAIGPSGFGYADGDDATTVPNTPSLYLRRTFDVNNLGQWLNAQFFMDYDDGFIAYLNGVEIARGNTGLPGEFVAWNQALPTDHEAVIYQGGMPDASAVDLGLLQNGLNTLAIQLHNVSLSSSDFTGRPFLFAGAPEEGLGYGDVPDWLDPDFGTMHPVTFEVNMANEDVSPEGVYVAGGSYFGIPGDHPMFDGDGDGIWSVTIDVPDGFSGYYTFLNGNCSNWSCKENIAGLPCSHPDNYNDRMLENITGPYTVSTCFAQCTTDGSCAEVPGCTDPEALNYIPAATEEDGSCVYFAESNLPIIEISTPVAIPDDPRIIGSMAVINNPSGFNQVGDAPTDYDGQISIEIRGSSSQMFPKKSYALETQTDAGENNNVMLLGMPAENDWILHGPYTDKTLMRNTVVFELGAQLGRYTPRRRYCELFINGDYRGVYMLMENIKRDVNRVDIATLLPTDTAGNELTGGYILKVDKFTGDFGGGWSSPYPTVGGDQLVIQHHKPEATELHPLQQTYIQDHITAFEDALAGPDFADPELGYAPYIDVHSFIDLYLINELSKNIDGYRLSTYFYKEKDSDGGKIVMGPWWDYNLALGNANYCDAALTDGFEVNTVCGNANPFWWERLLEDENYRDLTRCRWEEYRNGAWSNANIHATIDSVETLLGDAQIRDHIRWPRLGQYVWPNAFIGANYAEEMTFMRDWIDARLAWLDANILGQCAAGCTNPSACNYDPNATYDNGGCEPCGCPGDINADFAVSVMDVLLLLAEFGCYADCTADLDEDNVVSVSDLLFILSNYGAVCL